MSLGIIFKGAEGIILAADSRVTLTAQLQPQQPQQPQTTPQPQQPTMLLPATYDNATKLLRVNGQNFVGAVTYGVGAIGQNQPRTAHSYIPEFETELAESNTGRLSVEDFAKKLSNFFMRQWQAQMPQNFQGPGMVFLVGGYDEKAPYGRCFELEVPARPNPKEWHAGPSDFGMVWGGQREYTDRLVQGFDDNLLINIQQFLKLSDTQRQDLREYLRPRSNAPIPFPFLPLQDCVDVSIFLIRTTIAIQNWMVGIRGVGGAIDVATITRTEGFKPIQQKSILGERNRGGF